MTDDRSSMAEHGMVRLKFLRMTGGATLVAAVFGITEGKAVHEREIISLPPNPLHGIIAIGVEVHPTDQLSRVEVFIDGHLIGTDFDSPYAFVWDTRTERDGTHVVRADAVYRKRRHTATMTVVVDNAPIVLYPSPTLYPTDTLVL